MKMYQAIEKDADRLYKIILECSEWLKSLGIDQWNPPYPLSRFSAEIRQGDVLFFQIGEEVVGTVTLLKEKPDYYPQDLWTAGRAWYICRLAVPRAFSGEGFGSRILDAVETGAREKGIESLRLDIVKSNIFLKNYYKENGFKAVREDFSHGALSLFMEKRIDHSFSA